MIEKKNQGSSTFIECKIKIKYEFILHILFYKFTPFVIDNYIAQII